MSAKSGFLCGFLFLFWSIRSWKKSVRYKISSFYFWIHKDEDTTFGISFLIFHFHAKNGDHHWILSNVLFEKTSRHGITSDKFIFFELLLRLVLHLRSITFKSSQWLCSKTIGVQHTSCWSWEIDGFQEKAKNGFPGGMRCSKRKFYCVLRKIVPPGKMRCSRVNWKLEGNCSFLVKLGVLRNNNHIAPREKMVF